MSEWNDECNEWLVSTGNVHTGAIVGTDDGELYAVTPEGALTQSEYDANILAEDGETYVTKHINETHTILDAIHNGTLCRGLWLNGEKYTIVKKDKVEGFHVISAAKKGTGLYIVNTGGGYGVLVLYSEDQGQSHPNALLTAIEYATYLKEQGY